MAIAAVRDISETLDRIRAVVGDKGCLTAPEDIEPFVNDERGRYRGAAPMVVRPASTAEVAHVVAICAEHGLPIVPQAGNTGLVGGSVPHDHGGEIVLSCARLNRIRDIDPVNYTMTAEAGCVLADLQDAAGEADRLFPLSLGAEGSCMIGGNLGTNAGGINVLRYGMARDLVLGIEAVLPDGSIWEGLRGLRKDNTGYDLKHLFIGAEGTLGIITAAVLKLFPMPRAVETAFVAVADLKAALELLVRAREISGDRVTGFEILDRRCIEFVTAHIPDTQDPMGERYDHYALVEISSTESDTDLTDMLSRLLESAMEDEIVLDGVVASSTAQAAALWRLRESMNEAQKFEGASVKHDVSVPVSAIPDFIPRAIALATGSIPGCRPVAFGHLGDGNIHFNVSQPIGADPTKFFGDWEAVKTKVYDLVHELDGSFSAEHGIGRLKRADLTRYRPAVEIDLMRRVKAALDPQNIMNPGKIL